MSFEFDFRKWGFAIFVYRETRRYQIAQILLRVVGRFIGMVGGGYVCV